MHVKHNAIHVVTGQADKVRQFKSEGLPQLEIQAAVAELKARKKALEKREAELTPKEEKFDRNKLEDLLKRRFFYGQSFAIYGGKSDSLNSPASEYVS